MAMWDDILNGLGIDNGAARVNADVDRIAGSERGANGSFNPNAVRAGMPAEMDPEINMQAMLSEARLKAMQENMQPPTNTPMEWLGRTLSAASVPVAFAQGNQGFGLKMAGNTLADQYNERKATYQDTLAKEKAGIVDGAYSALGDSAVGYMKGQRERKSEGRKQISAMLSAAMDENGKIDPGMLAQVEMWAGTNGFKDIWDEVKGALPLGGGPSAPSAGTPPAAAAPSPAVSSDNTPGFANGGRRGVEPPAAQPSQGGPGLQGLSAMAGNLPGAAPSSAAPAAPAADKVSDTPPAPSPATQALIRRANMLALTNPEAGKMIKAQAEASYKAELDVWKTKLDDQAGRGKYGTSNSVWFENTKDPSQRRVGQLATGGGARIAPFLDAEGNPVAEELNPADWRQIDPSELAGLKASMSAQGTAQGTAASSIPAIESDYEVVSSLLDQIMTAPGLEALTGKTAGGLLWQDQLPDFYEDTGNARTLVEQLDSSAFKLAFESLKGAGAITEAEGKAATVALSRLQKMRVSDAAFKVALQDFVKRVDKLRKQAYEKAQNNFTRPGQAVQRPDPNAGATSTGTVQFDGLSDDELLKRRPGGR